MGRPFAFLFLSILTFSLFPGLPDARAQTIAGLKVEIEGELSDSLKQELRDTFDQVLSDSPRFHWLGFRQTRQALPLAVLDCFTADCLVQAGDHLGAQIGLFIDFEEDTGIYEWTLSFYDLLEGAPLHEERGLCELCGRQEVVDQFTSSLELSLANIPRQGYESAGPLDTRLNQPADGKVEVRVAVVPEDTRIFIDDEPAGVGNAEIRLEPGTYELRLSHDTHHGLRETLIISEASPPLVILRAHLSGSRAEQRTVLTRGDGLIDHIEPNRKIIAISALGAGGVMTIAGYIIAGLHGQPACPQTTAFTDCPDLYRTAGLGTTIAILGGISMVSGGVLLAWPLLAGSQKEKPYSGSSLQVGVGPTGFSLSGRF